MFEIFVGSLSLGSLLEMQNIRPHTQTYWMKSGFNKISRWFVYKSAWIAVLSGALGPGISTSKNCALVLNGNGLAILSFLMPSWNSGTLKPISASHTLTPSTPPLRSHSNSTFSSIDCESATLQETSELKEINIQLIFMNIFYRHPSFYACKALEICYLKKKNPIEILLFWSLATHWIIWNFNLIMVYIWIYAFIPKIW